MSHRNHPDQKAARRRERATRKARAAREIPFHGVVVTKQQVLGQRYLAMIGLPFSATVAAVAIMASVKPTFKDPSNILPVFGD